jgi:hypothetical protein
MAFDPQSITDAINSAGAQLQDAWRRGKNGNMPENNLNPDTASLQFRIKCLEDEVAQHRDYLQKIIRALKNGGAK